MAFPALEELEGPITLTMRGKQYELPQLTAEQGAELHRRCIEGITEGELGAVLLGDVLTVMLTDGISLATIERVTAVALTDWRLGREAAEAVWRDPKAFTTEVMAPMVDHILAATETLTPPPGSTSSTKPVKRPQDHKSRGKKSSRNTSA